MSESEYLTDFILRQSILNQSGKILDQVGVDLERGAIEQADEGLKRYNNFFPVLFISPSPNLTDQENELYLNLQQRKYLFTDDGFIDIQELDERSERMLDRLEKKAGL